MTSHRHSNRWIIYVGLGLLAAPFLLSFLGFWPWSHMNCWQHDVDIHSGRTRYTRYCAFIPILRRVDESALSQALLREDLKHSQPDWRRVLTLSPGVRNSPHYVFHSAINQIRELEKIWQTGQFTPAAKRITAKLLLELWQQGQDDNAADTYLDSLSDRAFRAQSELKRVDVNDLPDYR